jgi:hypothetical protein
VPPQTWKASLRMIYGKGQMRCGPESDSRAVRKTHESESMTKCADDTLAGATSNRSLKLPLGRAARGLKSAAFGCLGKLPDCRSYVQNTSFRLNPSECIGDEKLLRAGTESRRKRSVGNHCVQDDYCTVTAIVPVFVTAPEVPVKVMM